MQKLLTFKTSTRVNMFRFHRSAFITIGIFLAFLGASPTSVDAAGCDGDCLEAKLEEILKKLNGLDDKLDTLNTHPQSESHSAHGCARTRTGHRKHLETRLLDAESPRSRSHLFAAAPHVADNDKCSEKLLQLCQGVGVSEVQLDAKYKPFAVLCEADRWMVIMQRLDGSVHFHNKTWEAYKHGFGNVKSDGEFFVGLQHLHDLTFSGFFELRIDLEDFDGVRKYAHYSDFSVFNERGAYKLGTLGVYQGDAGDSFMYHEGQSFSTLDRDNDAKAVGSCGEEFNSAGWFKSCMEANLMGRYWHGENEHFKEGMYWETFRGPGYSLKSVKLSIKAKC